MSQASPLQVPQNRNEESLQASWKKGKQWSQELGKHVRGYFFSLSLIRPGQEDLFLYKDFVKKENNFKLYAVDFESSESCAALLCCSTREDQRLPSSYIMAEIKRLNTRMGWCPRTGGRQWLMRRTAFNELMCWQHAKINTPNK